MVHFQVTRIVSTSFAYFNVTRDLKHVQLQLNLFYRIILWFFSYFFMNYNYKIFNIIFLSIILLFRFIIYLKFLIFRYDEKYIIETVCY